MKVLKNHLADSVYGRSIYITKVDGRLIIILTVLLYFMILFISSFFTDYHQVWNYLGVPARSPSFSDLRNITSGADCQRLGFDSLINDPCDPWHRPMNYPRIWISLMLALHIHQEQTTALGIILALSFFCSLLIMVGRIHFYEGLFYGLLICSPAVMTGVERGNNDLVVFVLLVLAALGLTQGGRWRFLSYLLIGWCSVLKIYPAVALVVAFRERLWVAAVVFAVSAAVLAGYIYVIHNDLLIIGSEIPRAISYSYGSQVLFLAISRVLYLPDPPKAVSLVCVLGVIVSVFHFWRRLPRLLSPVGPAYKLMMGAALYITTFSFGNNFNYRMIFLLLIVPDLLHIARNKEEDNHQALLLLALLAVVLWLSPVAFIPLFLLKEALNWVLLASLVFALLQFLPDAPWTRLQTANGVSDRLA